MLRKDKVLIINSQKTFYSTINNPDMKPVTRVKELTVKYGTCGIVVFLGVTISGLGIIYGIVSTGVDIASIVNSIYPIELGKGSQTSMNFAIAYTINKLAMPLRIALSIYLTPKIHPYWVRLFGKRSEDDGKDN